MKDIRKDNNDEKTNKNTNNEWYNSGNVIVWIFVCLLILIALLTFLYDAFY